MSLFAALDADGNARYIGDVVRGAACGCFCSECKSPVVAKHGTEKEWHFAHEASQERPQCVPGSINLLRRLATERLLEPATLDLPECREIVFRRANFSDIREVATWRLPRASIVQRFLDSAFSKPVASLEPEGMPGCAIALWVQIGELDLETTGEFAGELVYHCPTPPKGAITTLASAVAFLQLNSRWLWQRSPDVFGELEKANARLKERVASHQAEIASKFHQLKARFHENRASSTPFAWSPLPIDAAAAVAPVPSSLPRPPWAALKKVNTSFFAFQMLSEGEYWIVFEAADHPGYYIVPGTGCFDGWDEALPRSFGTPDLDKGAYQGDGPVGPAIDLLRGLGVAATRIDSDPVWICEFTGWKD